MEICNRKQKLTSTRVVKNYSSIVYYSSSTRVLAAALYHVCRKGWKTPDQITFLYSLTAVCNHCIVEQIYTVSLKYMPLDIRS